MNSSSTRVEIPNREGSLIGSLIIPRDLTRWRNSTLTITVADENYWNTSNLFLGEMVLDITLLNSEGEDVSDLDSALTICLPRPNNTNPRDLCLGYFRDGKDQWRCEDLCLIRRGNELCGQTDHLTNFALLIMGNLNDDPCSTEIGHNVLAWISLGLVGLAILFVVIGVCLIEVRYRYVRYKINTVFFAVENLEIQIA